MSHLLDERLGVEPISVQKGGVTSYILWPMNASMPDDVIIRVLRYAGERPFVCARSCPSREMPDSTDSLSRFCHRDPGDLILILGKVAFFLAMINGREGLVLCARSETV